MRISGVVNNVVRETIRAASSEKLARRGHDKRLAPLRLARAAEAH
jgi:hypothetical protein